MCGILFLFVSSSSFMHILNTITNLFREIYYEKMTKGEGWVNKSDSYGDL